MYDQLSKEYDYFVNWTERLKYEMPFLMARLGELEVQDRPLRVLDAACGTGMHVLELKRRGVDASGADLSAGMIDQARSNARSAGLTVRFEAAGFGGLSDLFEEQDALLCLGNSLPHVLSVDALDQALEDFAACLRPGGLLLIQNRNFDQVLARHERWMGPESHRKSGTGDQEWIFVRFYDFDPDGRITFNILTLYREGQETWQQRVTNTRLWPQTLGELKPALERAGFEGITAYGGLAGVPFAPESSGNLVLAATRR